MNCLETQKRIRQFLDRTLPEDEWKAFLEHMNTCAECREELDLYCAIDYALRDDDQVLNQERFDEIEETDNLLRGMNRRLRIQAGIKHAQTILLAAVLIIGILFALLRAGVLSFPEHWMDHPFVSFLNLNGVGETEENTEENSEETPDSAKENME